MRDLVSWPGIEAGRLHWEGKVLTTGPPGKSLTFCFAPTLLCYTQTHSRSLCIQHENRGRRGLCNNVVLLKDCELYWSGTNTSLTVVSMGCFLLSNVCSEGLVRRDVWILWVPLLGKWITSGLFYAEPLVDAIYSYSLYSLGKSHSESGWMCFVRDYKSSAISFGWSPFGFIASKCHHLESVLAAGWLYKY